jgi:hypothetical protein
MENPVAWVGELHRASLLVTEDAETLYTLAFMTIVH